MHKISRIRFIRVGHPQAWFSDVTIDAKDLVTGEPCDTILFGANGDGKSTLIALLFSCFEPKASQFLKHLSKASQEFHEYFGHELGFVLVEWARQDTAPELGPRHLITGQAVALRNDKPFKTERLFFAFNTSNEVGLDTEPFAELRSFDALRRWVHGMEQRHRNDLYFYSTSIQEEWRERLRQPVMGVDPVLLAQQVRFSISEGGMDDAFLNFKSEDQFIGNFFDLTISRQHADNVREELVAYAQKHSDRPDKDKRLKALTSFRPVMAEFAGKAQHLASRQAGRAAAEGRSAALALALQYRAQVLDAEAEEAGALADVLSERKDKALEAAKFCDADAESFGEEILGRQVARADNHRKEADRRAKASKVLRNSIVVAQIDARLAGLKAEIEELDGFVKAASDELEPKRAEVHLLGGRFRFALQRAISAAEEEAGRQRMAARAADRRAKHASTRMGRAVSRANAAARAKGGALEFMDAFGRRHADLVVRKVLEPEEKAQAAQQRWIAESARLRERAEVAEALIGEIDTRLDQLGTSEREVAGGIVRQTTLLEAAEEFLSSAEAARALLARNRTLQRLLETDEIDPDAGSLGLAMGERIGELERQKRDLVRRLELLDEARQTIQRTDLAFHDEDVELVVDRLSHLGIGSAKPYAHWVADALRDASRARALVMSDPARFLGIHVQTAADLDRVRDHLDKLGDLPLRHPVVISLPHDVPAPEQGGRLMLGPRDDSAYNKAAAVAVLERLEHDYGEANGDLQRVAEHLSELQAVSNERDIYLHMYGPGPRAERQVERDHARIEHDRLTGELIKVRAHIGALKADRVLHVNAQRDAERESQAACANAEACRLFGLEYESRYAKQEAVLRMAQSQEEAAEKWRQAWERWGGLQAQGQAQAQQAGKDAKSRAVGFEGELAALVEWQAVEDGPVEPLDVLRGRYHAARNALIQAEEDKVGMLVVRRDEKSNRADELRMERTRAELPWDEMHVSALAQLDLDELDRRLDAIRDELSMAEGDAKKALMMHSALQGRLTQYGNARKHPGHRAAGVEKLADERLEPEVGAAKELAERHRGEAKRLAGEISAAGARARDAEAEAQFARDRTDEIGRAVSSEVPPSMEVLELPAGRQALGRLVDQILGQVTVAASAEREAEKEAQAGWEAVRKELEVLKDLAKERRLAEFVGGSLFAVALAEASSYVIQIDERIGVIVADLEQFAESTQIVIQSLVNLLSAAIRILNRASQAKIPPGVPKFSGLAVLKTTFRASDLPVEAAREKSVENFVYDIIGRNLIPATGSELAAKLLRHVAGGDTARFGIKILKPKEGQTDFYMPIDRVTTSGGEGLTTAILLYCVLAQLRAEEADNRKGASGGVLILDNPFAKANKTVFIQAQRQMAAAMGLQLIYATGLKDYNALGQFQRFWRLRPARRGKVSGRTLVEIESADLQIERQPDGPDRATA